MKILITSGGTKIPIDSVRSITNMSHGTLGSRMAKEFLQSGHHVFMLRAEGSKSPMSANINFYHNGFDGGDRTFNEVRNLWADYGCKYDEQTYKTFEEYKQYLYDAIMEHKPDMIILAAAVSDYGVEKPVEGKIRTKENLSINLTPLPKIISDVRKWAGEATDEATIIVGFKLLIDCSQAELLAAAYDSLSKNYLDVVCANDLRTILDGHHELLVCDKDTFKKVAHTNLTKSLLSYFGK